MTNEEQRKFLRFVVKQLKACHHELTVYRAFAQVVKNAGVLDADEVIEEARHSPEILKATEAYFAGFDELLELPSEQDPREALLKLLQQWKPKGNPN
jgi:hypothetical protein